MHPIERDLKGSVYDMCCKTDDGSRIIVEVQRRKQPFYPERALYYSTFQIMSILKDRPEVLDHRIFEKIFEVSELYNMNQDLREKVIHKMTTERDLRNQMAYAREEAIRLKR